MPATVSHRASNGKGLAGAPVPGWSELGEREHFVQFYDSHAFLLDSLSGYVHAGLAIGEAAIVIATPEHRDGLARRLRAAGVDVDAVATSGRYIATDAAGTLAKFMVDGAPDGGRFRETVSALIEPAATGHRVRIFGEMVDLLLAEGNLEGTVRLEELWEDLRSTHVFQLFCAYPIGDFAGEGLARPFDEVCAQHTRVIPAESYTRLATADERTRAIILLQQKAASLQSEIAERVAVEGALRAVKDELGTQLAENARLHQRARQELEERKQSLAREHAARAEAESANRMKDEFLATVSHELRTPLNAIVGWAHILQRGTVDAPTFTRGVEVIERNAHVQARLIEDILDASRVVTGNLRLSIGLVDPATVINAAIEAVRLAADAKGIRLEVVLDPPVCRVAGDAGRLQQVVWNLLSNAIKFTPSGGRVHVRLSRAGRAAEITVNDTGEGIAAEFLPFVFDRFRQADSTITRRHGGLGLGLAIVRHLVELHGGEARAESAGVGAGTTFTIRIPLADPDERASRPTTAASTTRRRGEERAVLPVAAVLVQPPASRR
jgi:signal transduction histidine kinase